MDQAAYGLSTFMVTAIVSRQLDSGEFGHFMIAWSTAWTGASLVSEALVTPLRIRLAAGKETEAAALSLQLSSGLGGSLAAIVSTLLPNPVRSLVGAVAIGLGSM